MIMNKANIFMNAGWVGLAGGVIAAVGQFEQVPGWISVAGSIIAVLACWVMLFTRNADEYTRGLWTAAASLAFAALLILFVGLPFAEGAYDGLADNPRQQDIPATASIGFAIVAFYIGLFWKRLRGD